MKWAVAWVGNWGLDSEPPLYPAGRVYPDPGVRPVYLPTSGISAMSIFAADSLASSTFATSIFTT